MNNTEIKINLMPDDSEIIPYNSTGIPIYLRSGWLSMYANMRSLCHQHDDIEFVRIHQGNLCYWVNGKTMCLKEGDCLIVNSRQMHYGYSYKKEDCNFTCIILPFLLIHEWLIATSLSKIGIAYLQWINVEDVSRKKGLTTTKFRGGKAN